MAFPADFNDSTVFDSVRPSSGCMWVKWYSGAVEIELRAVVCLDLAGLNGSTVFDFSALIVRLQLGLFNY
jgi:hypothetical protein